MSHENDLHVMPGENGWKVVVPHNSEPIGFAGTQEDAIHLATQIQLDRPEKEGGEVVIHGQDGRIRERSTINRKDPFPPPG